MNDLFIRKIKINQLAVNNLIGEGEVLLLP